MKPLLTLLLVLSLLGNLPGQVPHAFNYQGLARDNVGDPITNQFIGVKVTILTGSASGLTDYQETHNVETNDLGMFSLIVGEGNVVVGLIQDIDWAKDSKFLEIAIDPTGGSTYQVLGTVQLLSVPYALYAESSAGDGDSDPQNELQDLFIEENLLRIEGGNTVDLSMFDTDDQTLSLNNTILSISEGNTVDLSPIGQSESQELQLESNILSITRGTVPVNLAKYLDNTDNQELSLSGTILSIDRGNSLDLSGLSSGEGSTTDELQTLYITGNTLGISSGNEITLPTGAWTENGDLLSYEGNVEINGSTDFNGRFTASGSNNYETFSLRETLLPHTGPHEAILRLYNSSQGDYSEANILFAAGAPDHARAVISGSHDVFEGTYAGKLSLRLRNGDDTYLNALDVATSSASFNVPLYINSNLRVTGDLQVDGTSNLIDGDGDSTNELQTLSIDANFISISDGNEVKLPASEWESSEADLSFNKGKVTISPTTGEKQLVLADVFPPGGKNLEIGDDAYLSDIDVPGVMGIYSLPSPEKGALKLGSGGPVIYGENNKIGINTTTPSSTLEVGGDLEVNGLVRASGSYGYGAFMFNETNLPLTGLHEAVMRIWNSSGDANSQSNLLFATGSPDHARSIISSVHDPLEGEYGGKLDIKVRHGYEDYLNAVEVKTSETKINTPTTTTQDLHVTGDLQVDGSFSLSAFLPAGMIVPFAGDAGVVPEGWLLCDGSEINRTEYSRLFTVIGINYGSGDNSTTFNLPDFRGRFLRGVDHGTGSDPDAVTRTVSGSGGNAGELIGSLQLPATMLPNTHFTSNIAGNHTHSISILDNGGFIRNKNTNTKAHGNLQIELTDTGDVLRLGPEAAPGPGGGYSLVFDGSGHDIRTKFASHSHLYEYYVVDHSHEASATNNGNHSHNINSGGDEETRPVNVYVNYIIKY